jgi:uncharacterized protein (DUF2336 family)
MSVASQVAELGELVKIADPRRRATAVRQLAQLFQQGAGSFQPQHVAVFDSVLSAMAPAAETEIRADVATRFAPLTNAPPTLVGQLVRDADIRVSGPLLRQSPLIEEPTLVEIARAMGQPHLLAISERDAITIPVTDVLVRRGDRDVARRVAANEGARLSSQGYQRLIKRAEGDGVLAVAIGQRPDLSDPLLQQLVEGSVDLVRRRIFAGANPARKASIARAIIAVSGEAPAVQPQRDFGPAQRDIIELHRSGGLNKDALLSFAKERKYEETVAVLSAISGLSLTAIDSIVTGTRRDSILVLGKSLGLDWPTMRALLALRAPDARVQSATDLEMARANFERLAPITAQRVVKFWKDRPTE